MSERIRDLRADRRDVARERPTRHLVAGPGRPTYRLSRSRYGFPVTVGGGRRVLAYLTAPGGVRALLESLELPTRPARSSPRRRGLRSWRGVERQAAVAYITKSPASPLRGARPERACAP